MNRRTSYPIPSALYKDNPPHSQAVIDRQLATIAEQHAQILALKAELRALKGEPGDETMDAYWTVRT